MNLTGQTSEAVAALALVREGFEVSAPIFTRPVFDLVAKWGRAIHAIQVKGGTLFENGKTIQWHTCTNRRMYTPSDCSYFGLVLISRETRSGGFRLRRSLARGRCAPIPTMIRCLDTVGTWIV